MLTNAQLSTIRNVQKKKFREEHGFFLLEGEKFVRDAQTFVDFTFTRDDVPNFDELVTTETPQSIAAIARVPKFAVADLLERPTIVVLDGVQDPGNVGTILRSCLGFDAALVLIESADITSPKVVRSSASAIFQVPWMTVARSEAVEFIEKLGRPIYRLELRDDAIAPSEISDEKVILIAGNEGNGITLPIGDRSVAIRHNEALESLNVAMATTIVLYERSR